MANVSLGVNETYTVDDEKRKLTTFVDVQIWGPSAENLAPGRSSSKSEKPTGTENPDLSSDLFAALDRLKGAFEKAGAPRGYGGDSLRV